MNQNQRSIYSSYFAGNTCRYCATERRDLCEIASVQKEGSATCGMLTNTRALCQNKDKEEVIFLLLTVFANLYVFTLLPCFVDHAMLMS